MCWKRAAVAGPGGQSLCSRCDDQSGEEIDIGLCRPEGYLRSVTLDDLVLLSLVLQYGPNAVYNSRFPIRCHDCGWLKHARSGALDMGL